MDKNGDDLAILGCATLTDSQCMEVYGGPPKENEVFDARRSGVSDQWYLKYPWDYTIGGIIWLHATNGY